MSNILMYTNDKIYTTERMTGGIKRFKMLYDGLIDKGYNVTLYCGESQESLKKYNKYAHSIVVNNKKTKLFKGISIFFKNRKLIKKLKKEKYDCVIVFDVPTAIGLCLNNVKNINLFLRQDLIEYRKVMLDEKNAGKLYSWLYLKIMSFCEYVCCKMAKKIIVQCQYDLNNLINRHHFIRKSIKNKSYIQINNVNAPWIVDKSKEKITEKICCDKTFNIGFIGDFSSTRKGHDIFLLAIKKLLDASNSINAYLIGDGKFLETEKEKYSSYNNIHFLGRLNNPIGIIRQLDLVVVPSRADSCPNTILESLYNNCLVIGARSGGIIELLLDNEFLFELDAEKLEKKIAYIAKNKDKYDKMLDRQDKIKNNLTFDWSKKIIDIIGVNNDKQHKRKN